MTLQPTCCEKRELQNRIESIRKKMMGIAASEGLTSEKTLRLSQVLDSYIALYQTKHYNKS